MLTGDQHRPAVGERRRALPEARERPAWLRALLVRRIEVLARGVCAPRRSDEPFPERIVQSLGIRPAEARRLPFAKHVFGDGRIRMFCAGLQRSVLTEASHRTATRCPSSCFVFTGFTRCKSNPDSNARRLSASRPYPVTAMSRALTVSGL